MKKTISVLLLLTFLVTAFVGCNQQNDSSVQEQETQLESEASTEAETAPETEREQSIFAPTGTAPVFSLAGGVYADAQELTITAPEDSDYTVRYTTDGSVPTKKSKEATKTIKVAGDDATVVRAACFDAQGNLIGRVVTHTYIAATEGRGALYTVSLTLEPSDFDQLCRNYSEKIEMPTHIEIVNPAGELVISQDGGVRIFGGSSRSLQQKSLKIIARKTGYFETDMYEGKGTFRYAFFEGRTVKAGEDAGQVLDRYDSLILRNGGNDSLLHNSCDPLHASLIRDNAVNNFAAHVTDTLDYANSAFAVVYVNGEYYGILDMKENMNEDYVKRVYGVDDNDVVVVKSELDTSRGGRFDGTWFYYESENATELAAWEKICDDVAKAQKKGNMSYYDTLASLVDLHSFAEYCALNLYTSNHDWPHNNVKLWRYTGAAVEGNAITDGQWRFMTRDQDLGMGRYDSAHLTAELDTTPEVDSFYRMLGNFVDYHDLYSYKGEQQLYPDSLGLQCMLAYCLQNEAFRADFEAICRRMASEESQQIMLDVLAKGADAIKPEMTRHINRWSHAIGNGYNLKSWQKEYSAMKKYVNNRPAYFLEQLERALQRTEK